MAITPARHSTGRCTSQTPRHARAGEPRQAPGPVETRRRLAAVTLGVVGVAGLGLASAAQLTVNPSALGAGTGVVAACQPSTEPITTSFTTTFASGAYRVTEVKLSDVNAACVGQDYRITLLDTLGNPVGGVGELTGTVALSGGTLTANVAAQPTAESIGGIAVVIHS